MEISNLVNVVAGMVFFIFWLTAFVIFYHLVRFGIGTLPKRVAGVFLIGSVLLFTLSLFAYINLNLW